MQHQPDPMAAALRRRARRDAKAGGILSAVLAGGAMIAAMFERCEAAAFLGIAAYAILSISVGIAALEG